MNHLSLTFFLVFLTRVLVAQPKVYIAPFLHHASGAYTLIHDDFGATHARGIEEYIDTMTYNRHLPICFAAITGECDAQDWEKAKEMMAHGHQILNHSMTHKCGEVIDWCTFGNWNEKDFDREIDQSTLLIQQHTGKHPAFFIFPFDQHTDTMIAYLQAKHYMGARAGNQNSLNPSRLADPFHLEYTVFRPGQPITYLNGMADEAVAQKSWAIRVMHGIEDDSWGHITATEYASHLNHVQQLVKENTLWMATLSDVVSYQYLKDDRLITIKEKDKEGRITKMTMRSLHKELPKEHLSLHTSTIVMEQSTIPKTITQAGKNIPFESKKGQLIFDIELEMEDILLTY